MKIIFRTETEILRQVDFDDFTDDIEKELKTKYDDKPITKYEFIFKEGVLVKDCHRLEDMDESMVSEIIVTIN